MSLLRGFKSLALRSPIYVFGEVAELVEGARLEIA